METWVDMFWNSALQVILFAFLARTLIDKGGDFLGIAMLLGVVLWNFIWGAQYGITVGVMWEVWSRSFSSLFITPLTLEEFLFGQMLSSIIKSTVSFVLTLFVAWLIYHFSIAPLGWMLVLYAFELLVFGWAVGMAILSLIFRYGQQVQSMSWALVFLVQPFGAVFYPVSVLPAEIQWMPYLFPTGYVFEAIRGQMVRGEVRWDLVLYGTFLNIVWFIFGYTILKWNFRRAQESGAFARMEQ
ncbi:ABC transporter permease [Candidatus Gottesmanbacteria bacterium]|nr:ABC transporter permease [Candidatus Gottesmanbacteria bacterium]